MVVVAIQFYTFDMPCTALKYHSNISKWIDPCVAFGDQSKLITNQNKQKKNGRFKPKIVFTAI